MAQQKLPTPATSGDMYLNAVVEELRRLNGNIEDLLDAISEPVDAPTDEVTLKEPEKAKPSTRDAKQAAEKVTKDAVGPVTVETVEVVKPETSKKG